jgi:hypothetical protein
MNISNAEAKEMVHKKKAFVISEHSIGYLE